MQLFEKLFQSHFKLHFKEQLLHELTAVNFAIRPRIPHFCPVIEQNPIELPAQLDGLQARLRPRSDRVSVIIQLLSNAIHSWTLEEKKVEFHYECIKAAKFHYILNVHTHTSINDTKTQTYVRIHLIRNPMASKQHLFEIQLNIQINRLKLVVVSGCEIGRIMSDANLLTN